MPDERLLKGTERGLLLRPFQRMGFVRGWLCKNPLSYYLREDEEPIYLYDTTNPIIVSRDSSRQELFPDGRYRSMIAYTDERLLAVVGQKPNNQIVSASWNHIDSFSIEPESLKTDFDNSSEPREPASKVSFEFNTSERTIRFDSITEYNVTEILDDVSSFLSKQTNIEDWGNKEEWQVASASYQNAKKEYKRKQERERRERERKQKQYQRLAAQARGNSVTADIVEKVITELQESEVPEFYAQGEQHYHEIKHRESIGPQEVSNLYWVLFTNERVIIQSSTDTWRIPYTEFQRIEAAEYEDTTEVTRSEQGENRTIEEAITKRRIEIETSVGIHLVDIEDISQRELTELLKYVRQQM